MLHVRLDEMAGSQGRHEGQFTGHDGCADDPGEALGVCAGRSGVGAGDTEHLEHGSLGREDRAAANGTDFDRGHCAGHEQVLAIVDAAYQY